MRIPRVSRSAPLRASLSQRRLWFSEQVAHTGTEFVFPYVLRLHGELDVAALSKSLQAVVDRHEALRTTFISRDGEIFQEVHPPESLGLWTEAVPGSTDSERESALGAMIRNTVERPFDLINGPVIRTALFRLAADEHALVVAVHHIATDGLSMEIMFAEIGACYSALRAGRLPELEPLAIGYADFAQWQLGQWESGELAADAAYWRDQLRDAPPLLELPTDRPRPASQSFRGRWHSFTIPADTVARVAQLARTEGATLFMGLLAAFQLVLSRWSGQPDVVVGTPAANRPLPETEPLVGFFVNLLPIRIRVDERQSFRTLLRQVREHALDAFEHQELSFDRVVEEVAPVRTLAHNPVFQVTFALESELSVNLDGLSVEPIDARPAVSRYDMAFDYWPTSDGSLHFDAYYARDLFDGQTVKRLADDYVALIEELLARSDAPLAKVWRRSERPVVSPAFAVDDVMSRFLATSASCGDRLALVTSDDTLTFAQLERSSNAVAARLLQHGVSAGSIVGLHLARSHDLVVALLAILRVGAAYLPLDPKLPLERVRTMIASSGARAVVGRDPSVAIGGAALIQIDGAPPVEGSIEVAVPGQELAYVMFTSGSTGRPKGVAVTRIGLANLLAALEQVGVFDGERRVVGWNANPSFDASVQQWIRLCRGDTVVLLDDSVRLDPHLLSAACREHGIEVLDSTPSHWETIGGLLKVSSQVRLLIGGEALSPSAWLALAAAGTGIEAINMYGPTECTVDATVGWVSGDEPHIGRPVPGVKAYVLDRWLRQVPPGVAGELFIAGAGVARGYINQPAQTATRFLPDVIAADGGRMYRTGDRVRWRHDGNLDYLGRLDRQIKLRGFRVEPAEIERAMAQMAGLSTAVVVPAGEQLVAYYTTVGGHELTADVLRRHLEACLPEYMIPSVFAHLDSLPLTINGKVDVSALPVPDSEGVGAGAFVAPVGPIESLIAEVWAEVLERDRISANDNFFALGGHSLLAIRVIARLKKRMKLTVPTAAVFEHPSLRDLAAYAESMIRDQLAARVL